MLLHYLFSGFARVFGWLLHMSLASVPKPIAHGSTWPVRVSRLCEPFIVLLLRLCLLTECSGALHDVAEALWAHHGP